MNAGTCLERMEYDGPTKQGIDTLRALQLAFLLSIPFENLDIHLGAKITLSSEDIFEKIVRRRRGGVCFERNILFHDLLKALGFRVELLSARIVRGGATGPEFDHMVLLTSLDHDYLIDVGNGHFCRAPLRIDGSDTADAEGYSYRVGVSDGSYALYYRLPEKTWVPRLLFSVTPRLRTDFEQMNVFHQTSDLSAFTRLRIVTIATKEGRVSLIDRHLVISDGSGKRSRELESEDEYRACLKQYFGIEIPDTPE